jgi:hypothetical protein
MRAPIGCLFALLLTACAASKPMTPDVTSRLKQGNTAVLFHDDISEIKYVGDQYFVLGVAQVASNATYSGLWNPNPELSRLHAEGLAGLGLKAQSAYDLLSAAQIEQSITAERELYTLKPRDESKPEAEAPSPDAPPISPKLRDALIDKGQDTLVWVAWSGFQLHLQTLGLPPREEYTTGFWFFDLRTNQLLWRGAVLTNEKTSIPDGKTGKEFLESNGLAGLKAESAARVKDSYRADQAKFANLGVLSGLGRAQ